MVKKNQENSGWFSFRLLIGWKVKPLWLEEQNENLTWASIQKKLTTDTVIDSILNGDDDVTKSQKNGEDWGHLPCIPLLKILEYLPQKER